MVLSSTLLTEIVARSDTILPLWRQWAGSNGSISLYEFERGLRTAGIMASSEHVEALFLELQETDGVAPAASVSAFSLCAT